MQLARWVCDLPGEFCRFLTGPKKIFANRAIYRAVWPNHFALLAERERTTTIPRRKGVRRWELSPALADRASLTAIASWYWNMSPLTICGKPARPSYIVEHPAAERNGQALHGRPLSQIGRASCRERVSSPV